MEGDTSPRASPPNKRGYLSYEKCTFCRKDKKKVSVLSFLVSSCRRCVWLDTLKRFVIADLPYHTVQPQESKVARTKMHSMHASRSRVLWKCSGHCRHFNYTAERIDAD